VGVAIRQQFTQKFCARACAADFNAFSLTAIQNITQAAVNPPAAGFIASRYCYCH
jgi:hypothetical protein